MKKWNNVCHTFLYYLVLFSSILFYFVGSTGSIDHFRYGLICLVTLGVILLNGILLNLSERKKK